MMSVGLWRVGLVALAVSSCHSLKLDKPARKRASLVASAASPYKGSKDAFNNVRVPAALLSGSSFVAVNTAPLPAATDALFIGVIKRIYLVVAIGSFASTLLSVLVATIALEKMSSDTTSDELELEYVASQSHFFLGLLGSCLIVGLRAYISFTCPRFANVGLAMITSAFCLMVHFLPASLAGIPLRYAELLVKRVSLSNPFLLLALATGAYAIWGLVDGLGLCIRFDPANPVWKICAARK